MATVKTLLGHVKGDAGVGVPSGGTTGQILHKKSGTDYDTEWTDKPTSAVWGSITGTLSQQTDLKNALDDKADESDLTSHTGNTSNPHSVTKSQVGLGNVPNTDFTTPVANATAHIANTSNPHSVTKAQVGLGNVDNTSDANKPISTATQTALDAKLAKAVPTSEQGNKEFLYTFAGTTQKTDVALINDMSSSVSGYTDSMVPTALSVATVLANKEATSNKVTSVSSSSTDTEYPTAKCLYDMVGDIESALDAIRGTV